MQYHCLDPVFLESIPVELEDAGALPKDEPYVEVSNWERPFDGLRVDCNRMVVTHDDVYWTARYGDARIETRPIDYDTVRRAAGVQADPPPAQPQRSNYADQVASAAASFIADYSPDSDTRPSTELRELIDGLVDTAWTVEDAVECLQESKHPSAEQFSTGGSRHDRIANPSRSRPLRFPPLRPMSMRRLPRLGLTLTRPTKIGRPCKTPPRRISMPRELTPDEYAEIEAALEQVQATQTALWDALGELEGLLDGVELDANTDYEPYGVEALLEMEIQCRKCREGM